MSGNVLMCAHCGELPAVCIGQYEAMKKPEPACGECCAHGCEDGHCTPLYGDDYDGPPIETDAGTPPQEGPR